jgi:hypothetical protein
MTAICEAFPNGIPTVMKGGELEPRFRKWRKKPKSGEGGWWESPRRDRPWFFNHDGHPYPGDNGLLYEPDDYWPGIVAQFRQIDAEAEAKAAEGGSP